jgi:hypothetical protein
MKNSTDQMSIDGTRIIAKIILLPWLIWALFWTWFVAAGLVGEHHDGLPVPVSVTLFIIYASMYLGSAISAFRLKTEALGGKLLVSCGVLVLLSVVSIFYALMWIDNGAMPPIGLFLDTTGSIVFSAFLTISLPPIVAGLIFMNCHRISRMTGE